MSLLGNLFFPKEEEDTPPLKFGRYSDNNKTKAQLEKWQVAKDLFKEKKHLDAIEQFFVYLKDRKIDNVEFKREGDNASFCVYQGSKKISGTITEKHLRAEVPIAKMNKRSIPVLRKLLEKNYFLYYCKFYIEEDNLCLHIYNDLSAATPQKLYYAIKEIAIQADRLDDILVDDFTSLEAAGTDHVEHCSKEEKAIKYKFFKYWVDKTVEKIEVLNPDTFSGGIAYMLLNLVYKMDYLLLPEGKLTERLEEINSIFWNNRKNMSAVERNSRMLKKLKALQAWPKDEVKKYFYKTKHTFAITKPVAFENVVNTIKESMQNAVWYQENKHLDISLEMMEYSFAYSQFSFSLPKPATQLFDVVMHVNHNDFYIAMGFDERLYDRTTKSFNQNEIKEKINNINKENKVRYPLININTKHINFESLHNFNQSILIELMKLDLRKKS